MENNRVALHRDASGRLAADFSGLPASSYGALAKTIADRFGLSPEGELVVGLDETFQDYRLGSVRVGLEWDIWSGFTAVAKTPEAEPLVEAIARFLEGEGDATGR